jgi:hypothetical protein
MNQPSATDDATYSQLVDEYTALAGQALEGAFGPDRALWGGLLRE